jgi:hypothetical protein
MDIFGSGFLMATPTQDSFGNPISNPSPVMFAIMQEISLDYSAETKKLFGQKQFPVDVARGKIDISGKVKYAGIFAQQYNSVFFGQTLTAGLSGAVADTVGAVIPATPFTITPTPPGSGTFVSDQGVFGTNGIPYTRVASAPATGQYSLAAGVYTFAAADTGKKVYINYTYTSTAPTSAKTQVVTNLPMGATPYFGLVHTATFNGKQLTIQLPRCTSGKLSFGFKNEDFVVPEIDFEAFEDPVSGTVMTWSSSE